MCTCTPAHTTFHSNFHILSFPVPRLWVVHDKGPLTSLHHHQAFCQKLQYEPGSGDGATSKHHRNNPSRTSAHTRTHTHTHTLTHSHTHTHTRTRTHTRARLLGQRLWFLGSLTREVGEHTLYAPDRALAVQECKRRKNNAARFLDGRPSYQGFLQVETYLTRPPPPASAAAVRTAERPRPPPKHLTNRHLLASSACARHGAGLLRYFMVMLSR
jgi:hypothetical protein